MVICRSFYTRSGVGRTEDTTGKTAGTTRRALRSCEVLVAEHRTYGQMLLLCGIPCRIPNQNDTGPHLLTRSQRFNIMFGKGGLHDEVGIAKVM